jgi:hypothetical protein
VARTRTAAIAGVLLAAVAGACGDLPDAPSPTSTLEPTGLGIIAAWDRGGCGEWMYTLVDRSQLRITHGDQVCDGETRQGTTVLEFSEIDVGSGLPGPIEDGDLLLFASGDQGVEWYAVGSSKPDDPACRYALRGTAFDEGARLHFVSGLVLPKSSDYAIEPTWLERPASRLPKHTSTYCLTPTGEVALVRIPTGG